MPVLHFPPPDSSLNDVDNFDGVPVWETYEEPEVSANQGDDEEVHVSFVDGIFESIHGPMYKEK